MTQKKYLQINDEEHANAAQPEKLGTPVEGGFAGVERVNGEDEQEDVSMVTNIKMTEDARPSCMWIACGILVHLAWGTYPVFARYMQVILNLDGLLVLVVSNATSLMVVQAITCQGLGDRAGRKVGFGYAILITGRGATNMLTSKFTIALYTGIVTQFGPFIIALVSWVLMGESLPRCILPSLLLSTAGSFLVVLGQADFQLSGFSLNDGIGVGMAFVSILVSAGIRMTMKLSSASLSGFMLVSWQYMSAVPQVFLAALLTPVGGWTDALQPSAHIIAVVIAFTLTLPLAASYGQVLCVRQLGPSLDASIQPVRLVSTIVGGYLVLNEPVKSVAAWSGLALILVTLSVYLSLQSRRASGR